ncbi:MAG: MMPL family transporter [Chloroflexota bacterium]
MFFKLGSIMYKGRWVVIGLWVVLILVAGFFAPKATEVLKSGGFDFPNAESIRVGEELAKRFNGSRSYIFAVFTAPDGTRADDPTYAAQVEAAVAPVRQVQDVKQVMTFASTSAKDFISADGKYTYAMIGLNLEIGAAEGRVTEISSKIDKGNLDLRLTGLPVIYEDFNKVSQHDLEQAEMFTFPLALLILLLVFHTVVAAAMPLMMAMVSVTITLGAVYFVGQITDLSIFVLNISTMLGLGMGIDYSLFIVSRFREELYRQNGDVQKAIVIAIGTSGKAIFFSGLTVMIGLASLLLFEISMLRSIGVGGLLVVGLSVLAALTLLPAVLVVLGKKINAWKIPGLKPLEEKLAKQETATGFWYTLAVKVSKQPILVGLVVLAFLFVVGSPAFHMRFGEPSYQVLPEREPSRQGAEILDKHFPSYGKESDVYLLLKTREGQKITDQVNSEALYDYATAVKAKFPQVQQVLAGGQDLLAFPKAQVQAMLTTYGSNPALLTPQIQAYLSQVVNEDTASLKLLTTIEYSSQGATDFINALRAFQPGNLAVMVGGEQAGLVDFMNVLYADFPLAIVLVVVITYLTLFVMFQSVLLPLKAVVMTALSLSASYGSIVWIFQDGNLAELFGTQGLGFVEATLPILLFSILFGLSMDYEVFMLSRIKEHYDETGDSRKSVAIGLQRTGGLITSAAVVMVVVAGAFGTADIIIIKAVGIGMALAVLLDATIVRALLVPATMELLGKVIWWAPSFVRRMLPKVSAH